MPTATAPRTALLQALVSTTLIQLVATASAVALTPIAPHVARDFGVPAYLIGYQISLIFLFGALSSGVAGTLIARYGAVRIEQAALLSFALGLLGLATAELWPAALATALIGIGYGLQNPASSQILGAQTPPQRRNVIFSIKQAGVPLGGVVAALAFPMLDTTIGWRFGVALFALAPLLLALYLHRQHRGDSHVAPHSAPFLAGFLQEQAMVWSRVELRVLALLGLLYSSAQLSLSAFGVLLLLEAGRWTLIGAAAVAATAQIAGAVGRVSWGLIADRCGSGFLVLAVIGLGSAAAMLALPWLDSMPAVAQIALMAALGFCLSGWNGVVMAEITHLCPPAYTGRVIGGALVYTFIGVMIGPSGFATLYGHVGRYGATFAIGSAVMAAGAVAAFATARTLRRQAATATF